MDETKTTATGGYDAAQASIRRSPRISVMHMGLGDQEDPVAKERCVIVDWVQPQGHLVRREREVRFGGRRSGWESYQYLSEPDSTKHVKAGTSNRRTRQRTYKATYLLVTCLDFVLSVSLSFVLLPPNGRLFSPGLGSFSHRSRQCQLTAQPCFRSLQLSRRDTPLRGLLVLDHRESVACAMSCDNRELPR